MTRQFDPSRPEPITPLWQLSEDIERLKAGYEKEFPGVVFDRTKEGWKATFPGGKVIEGVNSLVVRNGVAAALGLPPVQMRADPAAR